MSNPTYAYWDATGMFRVPVAGTSYRRDAIEGIARNPDGRSALVICMAVLVPDDSNPHDKNAVAVLIQGTRVGYLARDYAETYRSYLQELPSDLGSISAHAAISNGLRTEEKSYEYRIELDIPDPPKVVLFSNRRGDDVIRVNGYPPLDRQPDGSYTARVWVPTPDFNELHKRRTVHTWTTEDWEVVSFYIANRQGIGLGFKVYEMPKTEYAKFFADRQLAASIELESSRFATLRIRA